MRVTIAARGFLWGSFAAYPLLHVFDPTHWGWQLLIWCGPPLAFEFPAWRDRVEARSKRPAAGGT